MIVEQNAKEQFEAVNAWLRAFMRKESGKEEDRKRGGLKFQRLNDRSKWNASEGGRPQIVGREGEGKEEGRKDHMIVYQ